MNDLQQQIDALTARIADNPGDADALYLRGALNWKLGRRAAALSDFNASALLDPDGRGAVAARGVRGIFDFNNPDLYNP